MINKVAANQRKMVTIIDPHIKADNNYWVYEGARSKSTLDKVLKFDLFA